MPVDKDVFRLATSDYSSRYLQEISRMPMLTHDEERMLAKRCRDNGDNDAAHKLVTSHLRLVARIAKAYRGYGLPVSDLISEGTVGLLQSLKRFDPDRGFRLSTYAQWWIRASIHEYVLRSWSMVKMGTTTGEKRLFFGLRKLKRQLQVIDDGDMAPDTVRKIADCLQVSEFDVVSMNQRLAGQDRSLNAPVRADGDGDWQDLLVDERESQEVALADRDELGKRQTMVSAALGSLTGRERSILADRRLRDDPTSLDELSRKWGISRERVRQIEMRAIGKLHRSVRVTRPGQQAATATRQLTA